jgi:hypothetical protein
VTTRCLPPGRRPGLAAAPACRGWLRLVHGQRKLFLRYPSAMGPFRSTVIETARQRKAASIYTLTYDPASPL